MCVPFSLSFGSSGPRAKERIEPNLVDELFPELLPKSYVCHPLLLYLSYLCDHSACQRAGGLELMLKSEYWNHSQGTTKTNTKHPSVLYDCPDPYPSVGSDTVPARLLVIL